MPGQLISPPATADHNKRNKIMLIVIALIVGILTYISTLKRDSLEERYQNEGVYIQGIVVDYTERQWPEKRENYTYYEFYVNEKLYENKSQVNAWQICKSQKKLCRGYACKIQYLKSDPGINRLIVD
ncbi:MAG: hypothetical protein IPJ81_09390 [Chitinophagaceae bacterium]|nr:hypothetical protein [Chitinophagaceae bacterium]